METPEYVTKEEVKRVCEQLGLSDWTAISSAEVDLKEAQIIRALVGAEALEISAQEFKRGLEIELEHGLTFPDANVTNNHPVLTGKIVLAHLKEMLDYYTRLDIAELEGDLLKAFTSGDQEKMAGKYQKLIEARYLLSMQEKERIKKD